MNYTIKIPKQVNPTQPSLEELISHLFAYEINPGDEVIIDLSKTVFFSSELTPILSAAVTTWTSVGAGVFINYSSSSRLGRQLEKNGFLLLFSKKPKLPDVYNTVIPLFEGYSQNIFAIEKYLNFNVFTHDRWPHEFSTTGHEMETINSAIYEIARNINEHSGSNTLHMCGQFYPSSKQLRFSLVDSGITIPSNIRAHRPNLANQNDTSLITWATGRGNSTKKTAASGMGLFDICSSISGHGEVTVLSNFGFWKQTEGGKIKTATMPKRYPGTAIHLLFDFRKVTAASTDQSTNAILDPDDLFF